MLVKEGNGVFLFTKLLIALIVLARSCLEECRAVRMARAQQTSSLGWTSSPVCSVHAMELLVCSEM